MTDSIINVSVDEALHAVSEGAILLDVREDDEWAAGHAPGAIHMRLSEVPDRFSELPRDRVIVCVCHLGGRSARAAEFLASQGFATRNLEGGMVRWAADDQPVHTPE